MARARALLLLACLTVGTILAGANTAVAADPGAAITVFAAASLRESFEAAAPVFTTKTGTKVTFNFAGSDTLAAQIAQGAPADVFASANQSQMNKLRDAGLLAGDPRVFVRNVLVTIVPKGNPGHIAGIVDLAKPGVRLVVAAPTVPVGGYARTTFANLSKLPAYGAQFADAVAANVVSNEIDVKAVVTKVLLGEADAGVCYGTDVTPAVAKATATLVFPPGSAPEAVYPIAVVKASANAAAAKAFIEYVLSPEGQAFLKDRGFLPPPAASN